MCLIDQRAKRSKVRSKLYAFVIILNGADGGGCSDSDLKKKKSSDLIRTTTCQSLWIVSVS